MRVPFKILSYQNYFALARLKVNVNGHFVGRYAVNAIHEIELNEGDRISFSIQYFKKEIIIKNDMPIVVFWRVSPNQILAHLDMLFKNCLEARTVDVKTFEDPHNEFYAMKESRVASDKGLSAIGLMLAIGIIYLSVSSTDQLEWWRDIAMVLGLGGAFRFLTFLFAKEVYPRSGFGAYLLFTATCVFLAVSSSLVFPLKLALMIIPLTLPFRAYLTFFKNNLGVAV